MASKKCTNLAKVKDELVDGVYIRPSKKKVTNQLFMILHFITINNYYWFYKR